MKTNKPLWKKADGELVVLKTLDTDHLQNIASLIVRREEAYAAFCSKYPVQLGPKMHSGQPARVWLDEIARILRKRHNQAITEAESLLLAQSDAPQQS